MDLTTISEELQKIEASLVSILDILARITNIANLLSLS